MNEPVTYLLFDGVLQANLLPWLYQQDEALDISPIYMGTRWAELSEIGPVLVQPSPNSALLADCEQRAELRTSCALLTSTQPSPAIMHHLQNFITVTDTLGSHSLLRFADPLVLQYWLASYDQKTLGQLLGPIDQWSVAVHQPRWAQTDEVAWQRFSSPVIRRAEPAIPLNHLGDRQVSALEQAYEQRFHERLDSWIEGTYPAFRATRLAGWSHWLEDQLRAAREWGLTTERSITIWITGCIRLGDDAFNATDSPYSEWLATNPSANSRHPDSRIQAFDQACLSRQQKDLV
ncbi:MAG: DUF4123 domain-containing protein [Halopseudomonas sp.]|uniref:DUF4123 domain-containing protein n=1 Tax=Halopseudomonas sp. TaxID=2901191 RepID=UPI0030013F7C